MNFEMFHIIPDNFFVRNIRDLEVLGFQNFQHISFSLQKYWRKCEKNFERLFDFRLKFSKSMFSLQNFRRKVEKVIFGRFFNFHQISKVHFFLQKFPNFISVTYVSERKGFFLKNPFQVQLREGLTCASLTHYNYIIQKGLYP